MGVRCTAIWALGHAKERLKGQRARPLTLGVTQWNGAAGGAQAGTHLCPPPCC